MLTAKGSTCTLHAALICIAWVESLACQCMHGFISDASAAVQSETLKPQTLVSNGHNGSISDVVAPTQVQHPELHAASSQCSHTRISHSFTPSKVQHGQQGTMRCEGLQGGVGPCLGTATQRQLLQAGAGAGQLDGCSVRDGGAATEVQHLSSRWSGRTQREPKGGHDRGEGRGQHSTQRHPGHGK